MQNNVGPTDRTVRIVVGVVMIALRFFGPVVGFLGGLLVLVGAYLLVTAAIGYCPVYHLFRYSTSGERVALGGSPPAAPAEGDGGGGAAPGSQTDRTNQQG